MTAAVRLFLLTGAVAGALLMQGVCRADGCCPAGCGGGCCCAYDALWYASGPSPANSATLTVWVPPGTDVYVDGKLMTGNGVKRRYYLTNLQTDPGTGEPLWYKCTVQADVLCRRTLGELPANIELTAIWVRDERRLSLSREVYVKAGDRIQLPFSPDVMTFREWDTYLDYNAQTGEEEWKEYLTGRASVLMIDDILRDNELKRWETETMPPTVRPSEWSGELFPLSVLGGD